MYFYSSFYTIGLLLYFILLHYQPQLLISSSDFMTKFSFFFIQSLRPYHSSFTKSYLTHILYSLEQDFFRCAPNLNRFLILHNQLQQDICQVTTSGGSREIFASFDATQEDRLTVDMASTERWALNKQQTSHPQYSRAVPLNSPNASRSGCSLIFLSNKPTKLFLYSRINN